MAGQRNPAFALLWISQALSQLGTSISSLAYPLLVLQESGSALDAGLVGAVVAATALVLRIPGGMIADRHRHRSLMLFADATRAAIVAGVAASVAFGFYSLPLILVAVALEVAFGVVFGPAEFALVRLVVPASERALAVGRMQSRAQLAGLLGPVLGGALFGLHPALPFAADAVSYAVSFGCVLAVRAGRSAAVTGSRTGAAREKVLAGLRWLRGQRFIWAAGWWVAGLTAAFGAVGLAILVLARDRGASPTEIGVMYAISTAGGLAGALLTPALQRRLRPAAILRAAALVDLLATLALLPLTSPYLIGVVGAAAFFLAPAVSASLFGRLSELCPDEIVGRAQAALALLVGTAAPLAPALIGGVIDAWGPSAGIWGCVSAFAVLTAVAFLLPSFRRGADAR